MPEANQWRNPVRTRLEAGGPVLAITITTKSLEMAAAAATLGFDFLWVEMEHSPITLETLREIVLVTRGLPTTVFARVPVIELWTAKRVLDQGVSGVIFPFTSSAEHARKAADACHYPPAGLRGSGAGLATTTWPEKSDYYDSADSNIVTIIMIEEACAVERIDEIAATPGVDVLFIGTSDLSFSMGLRGRQEPQVDRAIEKIVAAGKKHGIYLGRPAASAEQIRAYMQQGFSLFQCTTELALFRAGARQLLDSLGAAIAPVATKTHY